MQTLDISKSKKFQFEVNINGINPNELQGLFEFVIGGIHYGFPVEIRDSIIKAEIPPLTEVVKKNITSGSVLECNLSVYGNGFHLEPWSGKFEAHAPVQMEAHMSFTEEDDKIEMIDEKAKSVEAKLIESADEDLSEPNLDVLESISESPGPSPMRVEENKTKQKAVLNENYKKLMKQIIKEEMLYIKTGKRIRNIKEDTKTKRIIRMKVRKKLVETLKNKKAKQALLNESVSSQCACQIEDPISLMESVGMTNKKTQERLLEVAKAKAGDDPVSIYDTIKKMIELTQG